MTEWSDEFREGYKAGLIKAAYIADGHRAMNLNNGQADAGIACSSVAAFIVQEAREKGLWPEGLPQPLIKANQDK